MKRILSVLLVMLLGLLLTAFESGAIDYPDNVDATTSASIVIDKGTCYSTTEYIANMIEKETGGDLHRIETVTPYTENFDELRDMNHDEMNRNFLPKLKESNIDS